jgi:hypothetical protein
MRCDQISFSAQVYDALLDLGVRLVEKYGYITLRAWIVGPQIVTDVGADAISTIGQLLRHGLVAVYIRFKSVLTFQGS